MSQIVKWAGIFVGLALMVVPSVAWAQEGGEDDVSISLRFPGSRFNPVSERDAPVLVSTGRLIGGWPAGGDREHGGYAGYLFLKNSGPTALTNLIVTLDVSSPLQIGEYDIDEAFHRPTGETTQVFEVEELPAGGSETIMFSISVPKVSSRLESTIGFTLSDDAGQMLASLSAERPIVPVPLYLWFLTLAVLIALFVALWVWGKRGTVYMARLSSRDWVYMVVMGLMIGGMWHLWIGRSLGFQNFARGLTDQPFINRVIGDFGWYVLFATAVLLVRKPGVATIIALFHEFAYGYGFGSVIPFGTGWYLRPLMVGITIDLYLAFVYKWNPSLRTDRALSLGGAANAAFIGTMPFVWTMTMHLLLHPSIANTYVNWGYLIPESITRGLGGILYAVLLGYPLSLLLRRGLARTPPEVKPLPAGSSGD